MLSGLNTKSIDLSISANFWLFYKVDTKCHIVYFVESVPNLLSHDFWRPMLLLVTLWHKYSVTIKYYSTYIALIFFIFIWYIFSLRKLNRDGIDIPTVGWPWLSKNVFTITQRTNVLWKSSTPVALCWRSLSCINYCVKQCLEWYRKKIERDRYTLTHIFHISIFHVYYSRILQTSFLCAMLVGLIWNRCVTLLSPNI